MLNERNRVYFCCTMKWTDGSLWTLQYGEQWLSKTKPLSDIQLPDFLGFETVLRDIFLIFFHQTEETVILYHKMARYCLSDGFSRHFSPFLPSSFSSLNQSQAQYKWRQIPLCVLMFIRLRVTSEAIRQSDIHSCALQQPITVVIIMNTTIYGTSIFS